jgi:NlpE-like protein
LYFYLRQTGRRKSPEQNQMPLSKSAIALSVAAIVAVAVTLVLLNNRQPRWISATFDPPYPETNARGDPIRAVLEGRIPCSDCEKLKVQLVLYENRKEKTPTTYWLGMVGRSGNDRVVIQGSWEIRRGVEGYPEALVYALDQHADEDLRYFWRINDNILLLLDRRMSPKAGNAAWGYMLSRYDAPYGPRTYNYRQ